MDYGIYDGLPLGDVPSKIWDRWLSDPAWCPEGGESHLDLDRRVRAACEELWEEAGATDVVVVSHVSPIKAAVAWALGVGVEATWRMHLDTASICSRRAGPQRLLAGQLQRDGPPPLPRCRPDLLRWLVMDLSLPPIGIWTGALDTVALSQSQELACELEELGYGAIWLPEVAGRDVMFHMGMLLAATERLVMATGIASIWARDAVTMTGGVKGLTEAFPERVVLGLGVSHHTLVEDLRGHTYAKPLSAMRTYLDAMDNSPYVGKRPSTPVRRVLAALGPKMIALAAEKTDGAHNYLVPPEHTATAREALGSGPLLCPEQAVVVETDPARAREIGRYPHQDLRAPAQLPEQPAPAGLRRRRFRRRRQRPADRHHRGVG